MQAHILSEVRFAVVEVYRGVAVDVKLYTDELRARSYFEGRREGIDITQDDIQLFECPIDEISSAPSISEA